MEKLPFAFNLEWVINDWILMCVFLGNDFLPPLPSLVKREGSFERLMEVYKKVLPKAGGYITDSGDIELSRVQLIMTALGEVEDEIFTRRQEENAIAFEKRQKDRIMAMKAESITDYNASTSGMKRKHEEDNDDSDEESEPENDVSLWSSSNVDWKKIYYKNKFEADRENHDFMYKVITAYIEGLSWVMKYYYEGCASWNWYFPFHYAPLASDFINIGNLKVNFEKGKPFKPLEQLMAVLPPGSRQHVPEPWGELMSDPESPIIDFYRTDFKIDRSGKKNDWEGVALLPFIEERRLLKCLEKLYDKLTAEEKKRNACSNDKLYVSEGHKAYNFLVKLYEGAKDSNVFNMNTQLFGINRTVMSSEDVIYPKETVLSPLPSLPHLPGNATVCVCFMDPM